MHDPDKPNEPEDLKDKQLRDREASRPLSRADKPEPLSPRLASAPLRRPEPKSDLVK